MSKRPSALHYAGRDGTYIQGIPARDLDAADIANLTDEQVRDALAPNPLTKRPLYRVAGEPKPERQHRAPKAEAPAAAPDPVPSSPE